MLCRCPAATTHVEAQQGWGCRGGECGVSRSVGLQRVVGGLWRVDVAARAIRVNAMTSAERAQFDEALAAARLAIDVGEKVREAREAAGLSQRELAVRMSTSQAAVARLEAGGTSATLTTLQKAAAALGLELTIDLAPAH